MRILVVNVNTTESITQAIARSAQAVASPGTEIVGLTPFFGADSVEGNFESYLAAIAVMDRVMSYDQPFDAVIQAGYGEHGAKVCRNCSTCRWWTSPTRLPVPRCSSVTPIRW